MAKKMFIVVEDSFIGMKLIKADAPLSERVVEIETDVEAKGMSPGSNLMPAVFNETKAEWEIETIVPKPAKKKAAAPAADAPAADAPTGDATDLV